MSYDEIDEELGDLSPPHWLREHSAVTSRGIMLEVLLKPVSWQVFLLNPSPVTDPCSLQYCVWRTDQRIFMNKKPWAIKIVEPGSKETEIYDILHALDPASPNHTLPCEVIRHDERAFLIMPCLQPILLGSKRRSWGLRPVLDFFRQVVEVSHPRHLYFQDLSNVLSAQGLEFLHRNHIAHMVR